MCRKPPDDPGSDESRLSPRQAAGRSREEQGRQLLGSVERTPEPPKSPGFQFSLGDVMILTVGVAVGLAGGSWMPTDVFAAILGLATLMGLLIVSLYPPDSRVGKLIWASFVLAYFVAVVAALLKPPPR